MRTHNNFQYANTPKEQDLYKRQIYLDKLIARKDNGLIKVITGVRRCGKSFLLFKLYKEYLNSLGIEDSRIIQISLEETENFYLHNPLSLYLYIKKTVSDKERYYIFLDEIQFVKSIKNPDTAIPDAEPITFYSVLNGLLKRQNIDVYVTGSNSKMLSGDILTEFRGRGDEVRIYPLSFSEFMEQYDGDVRDGWDEYLMYGGLPLAVQAKTHEAKSSYLKNLFKETYIKDVIERNKFRNEENISDLLNILASSVGSLTNSLNIHNTFLSVKKQKVSVNTISSYTKSLQEAFLIDCAKRFDIKGRKYISTPLKYYFVDTGLRNALLNFRQIEETHLMENIIFNELKIRGFDVDVGVVEIYETNENGSGQKKQLEIDFVANKAQERLYIQSALSIADEKKLKIELRPFLNVNDSFKKIVIVGGKKAPQTTEQGFTIMGIINFLTEINSPCS